MKLTFVLSLVRCSTVKSTYRRYFFLTECECHERDCRSILQAVEDGYTESYIICPGGVVGPSSGPIPASSGFFRYATAPALAVQKAFIVGEGENLFNLVDILPPLVCSRCLIYLVSLDTFGRPC